MIRDAATVRAAIAALSAEQRDLLAALALGEPLNVTRLAEVADAVGLREAPTRQVSPASVREKLAPLVERELVAFDGSRYATAPGVRDVALRAVASSGRLLQLTQQVGSRLEASGHFGYRGPSEERLWFATRAALAEPAPDAALVLDRLATVAPPLEVALRVVVPALARPFDGEWLSRLPDPLLALLFRIGLPVVEATAEPSDELYAFVVQRFDALRAEPAALAALGGLAVLRGDAALLARIAAVRDLAPVARGATGALAVLQGRLDAAVPAFAAPGKKRTQPHPGFTGLLHGVALVWSGTEADLALAARLAAAVARGRFTPFRQASQVLLSMVEASRSPDSARAAAHALRAESPDDCGVALLRVLFAAWFDAQPYEVGRAYELGQLSLAHARAAGYPWLADQYASALAALWPKVPPEDRASGRLVAPAADSAPRFPPLAAARAAKSAWELSLERLERLAQAGKKRPEEIPEEGEERLVWRVYPGGELVEAYMQKRTGRTWSRGRKLALKHLMPGGEALRGIAPEDARIASHLRERRTFYGGFPSVEHLFEPAVWLALVGHPRVFVAESEVPCEVRRGTPQLLARTVDDQFVIRLDPPHLGDGITVLEEGRDVVVYEVDDSLREVVKLVGAGLTVPRSARDRALAALGELARVLPVLSTEPTSARAVPADPLPWMRLLPRPGGLTVTLGVRPLGPDGPQVVPGRGAVAIAGRAAGEAVHTDRDLDAEDRLAEAVLRACPMLEGRETAEHAWALDDPEACLELVSALSTLGAAVHVEWPKGEPIRIRGSAGRAQLRGNVTRSGGSFFAAGSLSVDEHTRIDLGELLDLVEETPGRFVRLESGDYVEIRKELRELLDGLLATRRRGEKKGVVAVPGTVLPVLEELTDEGAGFTLDAATAEWRERLVRATARRFPVPKALTGELRSYQEEGFRWLARLAELELGACLADDMGLGKTVQLLALLLHRAKAGPALVVAPTSVCENWRREAERFAPSLRVSLYAGPDRARVLEKLRKGDVVVTSYAILQLDAKALQAVEWSTAVLDEAQLIKNAESLRAQAAFGLNARVRVAATGTPVENHAADLFSIFHFLMPELLGTWGAFSKRFGPDVVGHAGAPARRAVRRLLSPFLLRRTKAQVLEDLPPLTEIQRTVTLSHEEALLYEAVRKSALAKLARGKGMGPGRVEVFAEIMRLRRLCCHPQLAVPSAKAGSSKLDRFMELVDELLEGRHRALVFSQFVDVLALARARLDSRGIPYQYLDGSTPAKARTRAVDAFQSGEGDLFLISLKAGGFGLNLTGADYVIHLDPWWNPAVEQQASDRAHRIGQTRPVTVYRLVTAGTVEERIVDLHRRKRDLADSLLEDSDRIGSVSAEDLRELLDDSADPRAIMNEELEAAGD